MSATTTRLPLAEAAALSWELVGLLAPYCERLEVLGSIRRGRPDCGDIELLAIPKTSAELVRDLFGDPIEKRLTSLLEHQLAALLANGDIEKRQPIRWGERYKAFLFDGFPVDLFICRPPAQWGVLSIIRTGSNEFCKRLVTPVEKGGLCPRGLMFQGGALWRLEKGGAVMVETPEETDVFAALGLRYVEPSVREVRD